MTNDDNDFPSSFDGRVFWKAFDELVPRDQLLIAELVFKLANQQREISKLCKIAFDKQQPPSESNQK